MIGRTTSLAAQDRLYRTVNGFAGLGRFEDPEFLDRLRMAQQCGQATPGQILTTALGLFRTTVTLVGFAFSLLLISPPIAGLVLLGGIPTLVGELRLAGARVRTTVDVSRLERREVFYGMLLANVQAAKEIRLFRLGDHFRARMKRDRMSINGLLLRMDRRTLLTQGGLAVLAAGIAAVGLLWAVRGAAAGTLSIGDVSVFVAAVAAVQSGAGALAIGLAVCHEHLLVYGHYRDVVRVGPDLPQVPGTLEPLRRGIELSDVWFRYSADHPWILRGVTLTIGRGRSLALVGVNGAGKSTLVKLLCRFYDPTRGTIRWDGVDIRQVPIDVLRARMSAIFQDFMRYDVSAAENIGLGDLTAGTDALVAAARLAGIDETLSALPNGYDTMLTRLFTEHADPAGTRGCGVVLSGGQWQRVALARALVRDRRDLLVMDEPSSGLDAEAEYEIQARLREHAAGQTTLLITHRLGAVRDADAIAVLHDGVVAEYGDHHTLMAADGHYARLFAMQAEGYVVR
jgi:ATP-binding cassette subfamily B protein